MRALLQRCIDKTHEYVDLANEKFNLRVPYPDVRFDVTGGNAGLAGLNYVRFNPAMLVRQPEEFLYNTPGHEVAHIVARHLNWGKPIDPHGVEWKRVMWAFSLPATRCHNYDVAGQRPKYKPKQYRTSDGVSKPVPFGSGGREIDFDG